MEPTKERLTKRLVAAIQDLPEDKIIAALHFVERLQDMTDRPERGSAGAISQALDLVGPLQFEPGEMDLEERG